MPSQSTKRPKQTTKTTGARATKAAGKPVPAEQPRQLARPQYKSFKLSKRLRHPRPKILGSFRIFKQSITSLSKRKRFFAGIVLIYLILTIVLVKGFGVGSGIPELKDTLAELFQGEFSQVVTGVSLFAVLLGNLSSTPSDQANVYQTVLLITTSLAVIWALRQNISPENKKTKLYTKDAFYKGMYPLVPFVLVLIVIGIQLLPVAVAGFLYSTVITGGLAVTAIEKALWLLIVGALLLLSLYMVTSSIFALYIVTLPNLRPMQALRSARELVRHRRWSIMRKVLFLPVALLLVAGVVTIPLILTMPGLAEWVFFVLSMFGLVVFHSYLYTLYRELL
ncbi:hypothetical protein E6P97_03625 [Patescibacteria group bacterium]|nr:MAG: hypothetical protein E6P97_03625 [Patescibacteria group bacterium]